MTRIRTSFTILLLVMSLLTTFPVSGAGGGDTLGSLTVCKVTAEEGVIIDGSDYSDDSFAIDITGPESFDETVTFELPLDLNSDILDADGNDAQCVVFDELAWGNYEYSQETINGAGWSTPLYNDQYDEDAADLGDFDSFDEENSNSNGDILVREERPDNEQHVPDRELVVLNQRQQGLNE